MAYNEKVVQLAKFIDSVECGESPNSIGRLLCNPGCLRWSKFQSGYQTINGSRFAKFSSYEIGFEALCFQIQIACDGRSKVYSPENTLYQFFAIYAPAYDKNQPKLYAERAAARLGIPGSTQMKMLIT